MEKVVLSILDELESKLKELRDEYNSKVTLHVDFDVSHVLCGVGREIRSVMDLLNSCVKGKD